jgi:hypothetical protein
MKHVRLSAKARKHLRQIIQLITKDPKKLDMSDWTTIYNKKSPQYTPDIVGDHFNSCGTVGCIAGWIMLNEFKEEREKQRKELVEHNNLSTDFFLPNEMSARQVATQILGPEVDTEALFHAAVWPQPFRAQYRDAKTPAQKAKITAELLQAVLDTDGGVLDIT